MALMHEGGPNRYWRALFGHLRQLGYVEGQNLLIERYGKEQQDLAIERYGRDQSIAALVADVVRSNPDVVYVVGIGIARFCKRETDKIPIVALTSDPVASGLIQSLAHPSSSSEEERREFIAATAALLVPPQCLWAQGTPRRINLPRSSPLLFIRERHRARGDGGRSSRCGKKFCARECAR
jgi:hypothetical protein